MVPLEYNSSMFPKVHILDSKIVSFDKIDGEKFFGISALVYDPDTKILYMLSDRSRLFAFSLQVKNNKITLLKPLWGKRLRDKYGHKFFVKSSDSEGMTLVKQGNRKFLLISFEQNPRVMAFDLKGRELAKPVQKSVRDLQYEMKLTHLPPILRKNFAYRKRNKMLESVTYTPKQGMITTPEYPLRKTKSGLHGIYNQKGRLCYIHMHGKDLAITELETLADGNLLALQRGFSLGKDIHITLQLLKIYLDDIDQGICKTDLLFHASTDEGWALDNFEGLTVVGKNLYLMVSDDNDNFFQKSMLVLFSIN
jgi:hypothetical protein